MGSVKPGLKDKVSGGRSKNASTALCGRQPNNQLAATILLVSPAQWVNITRAKLDIFLNPANLEVWQLSQLLKRQGLRPTSRIIATKTL